jgi:hypothetical protein
MSAENTIYELSQYCVRGGDLTGHSWTGKNGMYHWNVGKTTAQGLVNGVVRKLAGIDASGKQIWVVAGSFKIAPDGTILRFTGLAKKDQVMISRMGQITEQAHTTVAQTVAQTV